MIDINALIASLIGKNWPTDKAEQYIRGLQTMNLPDKLIEDQVRGAAQLPPQVQARQAQPQASFTRPQVSNDWFGGTRPAERRRPENAALRANFMGLEPSVQENALEGLYNRTFVGGNKIASRFNLEQTYNAQKNPHGILMDMRGMSWLNDKFSHTAADIAIGEFAKIIEEVAPGRGASLAQGGDEFFIGASSAQEGQQMMQTIQKRFSELKLKLPSAKGEVTVTGLSARGVVTQSPKTAGVDILKEADLALTQLHEYENQVNKVVKGEQPIGAKVLEVNGQAVQEVAKAIRDAKGRFVKGHAVGQRDPKTGRFVKSAGGTAGTPPPPVPPATATSAQEPDDDTARMSRIMATLGGGGGDSGAVPPVTPTGGGGGGSGPRKPKPSDVLVNNPYARRGTQNLTGVTPTYPDIDSGKLSGSFTVLENGLSRLKVQYRDATGAIQKFNALLDESGNLMREAAPPGSPAGTPGRLTTDADLRRREREALRQQEAADLRMNRYSGTIRRSPALGATYRYPQAFERLAQQDPRFIDPNSANIQAKSMPQGLTRVTSSFKDQNDVMQKAEVTVDRYGNVIDVLSKRYKSFGEQLRQNYGEILKWSLAVSAIYGPMQKLNELISNMIQNQSRLAQIQVTLGTNQATTNKIFEEAADIAKQTGTDLEGVIEGYNLAFRASGSASSQTEKFAKANELLIKSIQLSKIANIEQAAATDILSASYKQVEDRGITLAQLLDKWVAVSRTANVDVNTLATTFSIVAESALSAGLSVDELNGLIATLAEKSSLSAKETGNAVRAILSGYTTDAAKKVLGDFGVAVTDVAGKTRNLKDVFGDIKTLTDQGIISPDQLNNIALVLGGGNRRQAQTVMAIMGQERMSQIAGVSETAPVGGAERATGILVNTISGNLNRLNVSFGQLAQSLGTDGGLLDALNALVKAADGAVNIITSLSRGIGGAFPMLMGLGLTSVLTRKGSPFNLGQAVFGGIGKAMDSVFPMYDRVNAPGVTVPVGGGLRRTIGGAARRVGGFLEQNAGIIGTGLMAGGVIASRAASGDTEGAGMTGVGLAGGAIAGLLAGLIPGVGLALVPVGMTVGTIIGEAFASEAKRRKNDIAAALASSTGPNEKYLLPEQGVTATKEGETIRTASKMAAFGPGFESIVKQEDVEQGTNLVNSMAKGMVDDYNNWLRDPENQKKMTDQTSGRIIGMSMDNALKILATSESLGGEFQFGAFTGNLDKYGGKYEKSAVAVQRMMAGQTTGQPTSFTTETFNKYLEDQAKKTSPIAQSPFLTAATGTFGENQRGLIAQLQQRAQDYLSRSFQGGDISARSKATKTSQIENIDGKILQLGYAMEGFGNTTDNLTKLMDILVKGTDEEIQSLLTYSSSIKDLSDKIKAAEEGNTNVLGVFDALTNVTKDMTPEEANKVLDRMKKAYAEEAAGTFSDISNRQKVSGITDYTKRGYTAEDIAKFLSPEKIQQYLGEVAGAMRQAGRPEEATAFLSQQAQQGFYAKYVGGMQYVQGISADQAGLLEQQMRELGDLVKGTDVQEIDYNKSEVMSSILPGYSQLLKRLTGAGYTENLENVILYTKDKELTDMLRIDNKVLQMYLKELNDKAQKQLDGMFNLPEGASFYVPYSALTMSKTTKEAMPGTTDPTKNLTDAVRLLGDQIRLLKEVPPTTGIPEETRKYFRDTEEMSEGIYRSPSDYDENKKFFDYEENYRTGLGGQQGKQGGGLFDALNNFISTLAGNVGTAVQEMKITPADLNLNIGLNSVLMLDGKIIAQTVQAEIAKAIVQYANSTLGKVNGSIGFMGP